MARASGGSVRRRVVYVGRVQGVGFRFTAVTIAERFGVSGFVRNLPDGTVELEAQGTPQEVDAFLAEVDRVMRANILEKQVETAPAEPGEEGFEIRY